MTLPRWLSNPYLGLGGLIASVAGLAFGVYAYYASQAHRDLQYVISMDRSVLIDSSKATDFEIKYQGVVITSDVTSVTLTIWNAGALPIKPENILEPLIVRVGKGIPVLEAKVIRSNRKITEFNLDTKNAEGLVLPKWKILEQRDGAVIQIIYAGPPSIPIAVDGTIEGQRAIREFKLMPDLPFSFNTLRLFYLGLALLMLVMQIIRNVRLGFRKEKIEIFFWGTVIAAFLVAAFLPYLFTRSMPVQF